MAKAKNKRNSGLADKVHNKRKGDVHKKKLNPFEVHINREKMKVLGQKSKHERGMPGVARARAVQKRKETLGTEMKLMHKTNVFTDRRIGEKDSALSAEERATARFAAERARRPRPALYNLADDELLTHRGQTLEQIEKFDDPRSSDDEDEDDGRKAFRGLDDEFVSEGHFGGGMLSRGAGGGAGGAGGGARSHQDLIDQLIADSKRRKADKQKLKEQTLDLTEKLDSEWRDLQPVVAKRARAASPAPAPAPGDPPLTRAERAALDYDQMTRELRFEKRGTPSDGLKSQEAQEEEERKQLAAWQRERDRRMRGEEGEGAAPAHTHRSAEDLDDNLELEAAAPGFMLAYDDEGRALGDEAVLTQHSGFPSEKKQFQDGGSDDSSDEEEREEGSSEGGDDDDDDDDDEQTAADKTSTKKIDKKSKEAKPNETSILFQKQTSDEDDDDEDEDEGKNGGDDDKDNETTDDDDDDETEEKNSEKDNHSKKMNSIKTNGLPKEDSSESDSDSDTEPAESEKINENKVDDISNLRVLLESEAESEDEEQRAEDDQRISTFFKTMSTEGYKLKALLSDKSPAAQAAALARLVKQYDPSKGEGNKEKLSQLFPYVVQFIHDAWGAPSSAAGVSHAARTLHHLAPILYDLAKVNKVSSMKCIVEVLKEKHDLFLKCPKRVPDLDTLVLFKLVSLLYPGSDYRHPVATPALVFMQQILTRGRFRDPQSISRGLFVAALILEYTALSKRLVPPVINFLRGLLYMAADIPIVSQLQVVPPFRARDAGLLRVSADCPPLSGADKMAAGDLFTDEFTDELKVRVISTCVNMLRELFDNSSDLEAQECIFRPHLQLLALVRLPPAPAAAAPAPAALDYMTRALEVKTYTHMCGEKKKTKMLRLYEPDVQDVFTGSKSAKLSVEASSRARLTGRLRRERRGAARELRRDAAYLAGEKLRGKIRSDNERKAKVKRIYAEAALQQGELNALKRQK